MTEKNNATCSICGNGYYACLSCQDSMKLHPWKIHCCSAVHFQVFQVVRGFSTGVYTKNEAKAKLQNINLTDVESFRPHIKKIVKDILGYEAVAKTVEDSVKKAGAVESVAESVETEIATKENIIENIVVKDIVESKKVEDNFKTTYSRKKNYK